MFLFFISEQERFKRKADVEFHELVGDSLYTQTKAKAGWAFRVLEYWALWHRTRSLEAGTSAATQCDEILQAHSSLIGVSCGDLDVILANFISQPRNIKEGEEYPPRTKHELITSIQKHFELKCKKMQLIHVEKCPRLYYALDVSMKESSKQGTRGVRVRIGPQYLCLS